MFAAFVSVVANIRSWFDSRLTADPDLGSPPPGSCPPEVSAPTSLKLWGPTALGLAAAPPVAMALGVADQEARNDHRLALQMIPLVLELEE
jgi:hypothetical protein